MKSDNPKRKDLGLFPGCGHGLWDSSGIARGAHSRVAVVQCGVAGGAEMLRNLLC